MTTMLLLFGLVALAADDQVPLKELDVTLPQVVGQLRYRNKHVYDGEGLGYSVAFGNKMCTVTIYVYDRAKQGIPEGKNGPLIADEMKTAADELSLAEQKGVWKNLKPMAGELSFPKAVLDTFAVKGYTFDVRGGGCKSYVLISGTHGHFVKVRATQHIVDGKTNDEELHEFLKVLCTHLNSAA